jgi:uncharacterized protein YkwD
MRTLTTFCLGLGVIAMSSSTALAVGESVGGFPNWEERTLHQFMNRSRVDPAADLAACPAANCPEKACYKPIAPLYYDLNLGRAARFHSDEMKLQSYFAHDSKCKVVPNIATIYPTSCSGAAACACTAGTATTWSQRVGLFGTNTSGEIIASPSDPRQAFYLWLHEPSSTAMCGYNSQNGHRYNILMAGPSVGVGVTNAGASVGDFGGAAGGSYKIPSGSHYPQGGASIEMWANWKDSAAPSQAIVNVEGTCTAMTLKFGTAQSGAWSTTLTGLGTTCKRYRFEWKDSAGATVTYPQTGSFYTGSSGTTGCASDGSDFSASPPPSCGCTPSCGGKQCGDDGCGSVCGTCGAGTSCQGTQCIGTGGGGDGGTSNADGGDPGTSPDMVDVTATGCSCDLGQSSGQATAPAAAMVALLGLVIARRRSRRSSLSM